MLVGVSPGIGGGHEIRIEFTVLSQTEFTA